MTTLRHTFPLIIFLSIWQTLSFAHNLPPGFAAIQIADGLDPVGIAAAPDGRIFLTEKSGRVRIVENGQMLLDPFLEIEVDNFNERGLSGIAIDPDFLENSFVYLYYTVPGEGHNRLSRFTAEGNFAIPGSEHILLELDALAGNNHNAGAMAFDESGHLYIATGDGTIIEAAQSLSSLLGKILRINKDGSIPEDNPFYQQTTGKYRSIWSMGYRNPFALTIEPGTGRLFATDVGSHRFEEVNEIFGGKNYGWPLVEGSFEDQAPPANYIAPLHAYNHDIGCAAVGVATYNPGSLAFPSEYWGKVFFSDYCSGKIRLLDPATGETSDFASDLDRPISMLTADDGSLYFIARAGIGGGEVDDNTSSSNGALWRIVYTGSEAPFISVQPKSNLVSVGENAMFLMAASGEDLTYKWQVNGADISTPNSPEFIFENAMLADSGSLVRCIVFNQFGADTTLTTSLNVTSNKRPNVEILQPEEGTLYRAGEVLTFAGTAEDEEDGALPPGNFRWKIDFHHNQHTHPAYGPMEGISGDSFIIPKIGEVSDNVWFRINFTATDSDGLSKTVQRLVFPQKVDLTIKTSPPGQPLDINGTLSGTPLLVKSVAGVVHDIKAPQSLVANDSVYVFKKWNTGDEAAKTTFEAPGEDFDLVAVYEPVRALADGQGLKGTYFNDAQRDFTFSEPPAMSRIDPTIDFEWLFGTPNEEYLGEDFFLVRWEGFVQPLFTDTFHFHVITDDGSRLWVDDQPLTSAWFGQGKNEYSGSIFLEKEKFYPIKLEYFEGVGHATIQLLWSSSQVERSIIPSSQLFPAIPAPIPDIERIAASVFPNPLFDFLKIKYASPADSEVQAEVFNAAGQLVFSEKIIVEAGFGFSEIDFSHFSNGVYFVKLSGELIDQVFEVVLQK